MSDAMDDLLPQGNRLQILSPEEYELLWGLPRFTMSDRQLFFALTPREQDCYERLRTLRTKLHFLLHLGYFKARQRFYVINIDLMSEDIEYLSKLYLGGIRIPDLNVSKHTRRRHMSWILQLFGFRQTDQAGRMSLEERALKAARISSRPVYVLRDLVDRLRQQRIVLPGYPCYS